VVDPAFDQSSKAAKLPLSFVEGGEWSVPVNQRRFRFVDGFWPAGMFATSGVNCHNTVTLRFGIVVQI
jgi:hypothetical protein